MLKSMPNSKHHMMYHLTGWVFFQCWLKQIQIQHCKSWFSVFFKIRASKSASPIFEWILPVMGNCIPKRNTNRDQIIRMCCSHSPHESQLQRLRQRSLTCLAKFQIVCSHSKRVLENAKSGCAHSVQAKVRKQNTWFLWVLNKILIRGK